MTSDSAGPRFLSPEFHTRFFPGLLRDRLRRKRRDSGGTTFTSNTEMFVMLAVCLVLAMLGIPSALARGSVLGWVLTALGAGGTVLLVVQSAASQWGSRPTYDDFLFGVFFFLLVLGAVAGSLAGLEARSKGLAVLGGAVGAAGGYLLGIFAGLQLQRLGWIATTVNLLAGLAAIVLAAGALLILVLSLV